MLIAGKGLDGWFDVRSESIESGSSLERVVYSSFLFLGLIILIKRRFNWYSAIKANIWLLVLVGYMFVSIAWSDVPIISLKRGIKELVAVVMALRILSEVDLRKTLQSILRRSTYVLIPFSLLLVNYFPDYGVFGNPESATASWIGVTSHKNALGRLCSISVLFLVWTLVRRWQGHAEPSPRHQMYIDMLIMGIALFLMKGPGIVKATSATAIMTLAVGLTTFFGLLMMKKFKRSIGLNALRGNHHYLHCFRTASVFIGGLAVGGSVTAVLGREESLTGRSEMWAQFLPHAMMEPIIGHGIGGFWTDAIVRRYHYYTAHNGYLDILLNYGFVGLLIFSFFLLSSCQKAHRELSYDYHWGSLWICFLLMALILNIGESSIESFTGHLTAILVFLSVSSEVTLSSLNSANNILTAQANSHLLH